MSLRPEPVTSKFRKNYFQEFYSSNYNLNNSHESSDGSTASLVSILYHNNVQHNDNVDLTVSDFLPENILYSPTNQDGYESEDTFTRITKTHKNGISREIIDSDHQESENTISELDICNIGKSYKRTIARKPDYPGSSVTRVKCGVFVNDSNPKALKAITNTKMAKNLINHQNTTNLNRIKRKTVQNLPEKPQTEIVATVEILGNSDYSIDFESISEVELKENDSQSNSSSRHKSCDQQSDKLSNSRPNSAKSQQKPIKLNTDTLHPQNAWEAWFMKKEKQKRQKEEQRRLKMLTEKEEMERKEKEKLEKEKNNQEKIRNWLLKKEESYAKELKMKQIKENQSKKEQLKKDEDLKKSKEKFDKWKKKKELQEQDEEQRKKDEKCKEEAEKMIKKAKAECAYNTWLAQNKSHPPPVPYSYGISDGKLTSYYDKTSNPPPTFFNPNPWIPIVEPANSRH